MPDINKPFLPPTQASLPRARILLVHDEDRDLKSFATLLGRTGFSVRAFMNYREAEACLGHQYFDIAIVSQGSPTFETHRLVRLTLARTQHTPVVVLTRSLEMSCFLEAMQLGAVDYLEKPLAPKEFERLVATHLQPQQGELTARNV